MEREVQVPTVRRRVQGAGEGDADDHGDRQVRRRHPCRRNQVRRGHNTPTNSNRRSPAKLTDNQLITPLIRVDLLQGLRRRDHQRGRRAGVPAGEAGAVQRRAGGRHLQGRAQAGHQVHLQRKRRMTSTLFSDPHGQWILHLSMIDVHRCGKCR